MAFANRVIGTHVYRGRIAGVHGPFKGHIFRYVDHHRTWATGTRNMKSLFHDVGHFAHVFDQKIVLHDGAGDAHGIAFLEGIKTYRMGRHLPRDDDHGNAVHISCRNTRHCIGNARP